MNCNEWSDSINCKSENLQCSTDSFFSCQCPVGKCNYSSGVQTGNCPCTNIEDITQLNDFSSYVNCPVGQAEEMVDGGFSCNCPVGNCTLKDGKLSEDCPCTKLSDFTQKQFERYVGCTQTEPNNDYMCLCSEGKTVSMVQGQLSDFCEGFPSNDFKLNITTIKWWGWLLIAIIIILFLALVAFLLWNISLKDFIKKN